MSETWVRVDTGVWKCGRYQAYSTYNGRRYNLVKIVGGRTFSCLGNKTLAECKAWVAEQESDLDEPTETGDKPAARAKEELIDGILDNPVYMPDSRLRLMTKMALRRLSCDDLANLYLIISLKTPKKETQHGR